MRIKKVVEFVLWDDGSVAVVTKKKAILIPFGKRKVFCIKLASSPLFRWERRLATRGDGTLFVRKNRRL